MWRFNPQLLAALCLGLKRVCIMFNVGAYGRSPRSGAALSTVRIVRRAYSCCGQYIVAYVAGWQGVFGRSLLRW